MSNLAGLVICESGTRLAVDVYDVGDGCVIIRHLMAPQHHNNTDNTDGHNITTTQTGNTAGHIL